MWSLSYYISKYFSSEKCVSNESLTPDAPPLVSSLCLETESGNKFIAGPGRNLPRLDELLKNSKVSLKSPSVIKSLNDLSKITEATIAKSRLRKIVVPPRQTVWPCTNPLFKELRKRAKQLQVAC